VSFHKGRGKGIQVDEEEEFENEYECGWFEKQRDRSARLMEG